MNQANLQSQLPTRRPFRSGITSGIALLCFAAGSLITACLMHVRAVRAANNRVFELMMYHTVPGILPGLEAIFRGLSPMMGKYGLNVVGYWVPSEDPAWKDAFIYLVAHPSLEEAKKNWRALHADPAFLPYRKAAEPLIE